MKFSCSAKRVQTDFAGITVARHFFTNPKKTAFLKAVNTYYHINNKTNYAAKRSFEVSAKTRLPFNASSIISLTAEASGLTSIRAQARRCLMMPSVAISNESPVNFE